MREAPWPVRLRADPHGPLRGDARVPGDKSISHRALILGGLAQGRSEIEGLLESADVMHTAEAMRMFGADVERGPYGWSVVGRGGFAEPGQVIDCGNAGTAARLILGAAAGFAIRTTFTGDVSLCARPMARVLEPLERMGARVLARSGARLPLTLAGGELHGLEHRSPVASAQVKSAVLLAGLRADGPTVVIEPLASRDHTERMLTAFGVEVETRVSPHGVSARVRGGDRLSAARVAVPGDPSSAAFPIVAALVTPGSSVRVDDVLLNPLRTGVFETLREMGADLLETASGERAGERVGSLRARAGGLRGVVVPPDRAPSMIDEYPILAVAAAFAEGPTVMRGIGELRVKESDRIALVAAALRACGVEVEEEPDGLIVHGRVRPAGGARIRTRGDHRIAMCGLVLGGACTHAVEVDEPEMIATSFPGFAQLMNELGASIG